MDSGTIIGIGASVGTGLSLLPQLIKIYKEKKPSDISYKMLFVLLTGLILWIWYGINKKDLIIIISNSASMIINIAIFILNSYYKKQQPAK